jgi:hypothetical protein
MQNKINFIETQEYIKQTRKLFKHSAEISREEITMALAENPEKGDLIRGTGGIRKLRWELEGRGKRGGARVIYYFYHRATPIMLVDIYGKNDKADLSQEDKKVLKLMVSAYKKKYKNISITKGEKK